VLHEDIIDADEECDIVRRIDKIEWVPSQSGRRKQDYGPKVCHKYLTVLRQVNFKRQKVRCDSYVGIPDYGRWMLQRMCEREPVELNNYIPFELCNLEYAAV
jgi:alkylated DNA repair protein alkB family protein 4